MERGITGEERKEGLIRAPEEGSLVVLGAEWGRYNQVTRARDQNRVKGETDR